MSVTVISPTVVKVEPDELNADDILEFAEALIEEHGHYTGDSGSSSAGWSIHGAIGEAAMRATGEGGKDGSKSRVLREAAKDRVESSTGKTEFAANDESGGRVAAMQILNEARSL